MVQPVSFSYGTGTLEVPEVLSPPDGDWNFFFICQSLTLSLVSRDFPSWDPDEQRGTDYIGKVEEKLTVG